MKTWATVVLAIVLPIVTWGQGTGTTQDFTNKQVVAYTGDPAKIRLDPGSEVTYDPAKASFRFLVRANDSLGKPIKFAVSPTTTMDVALITCTLAEYNAQLTSGAKDHEAALLAVAVIKLGGK